MVNSMAEESIRTPASVYPAHSIVSYLDSPPSALSVRLLSRLYCAVRCPPSVSPICCKRSEDSAKRREDSEIPVIGGDWHISPSVRQSGLCIRLTVCYTLVLCLDGEHSTREEQRARRKIDPVKHVGEKRRATS